MQRIVLATVKPTASLPEGLKSIRAGTRAVVINDGHGSRMITAGDIFEAMNEALDKGEKPKDVKLAEVKPSQLRIALEAPVIQTIDRFGPPGSVPSMTSTEEDHFSAILMTNGADDKPRYTVEEIGPASATIVTSSETFADALAKSVTVCKCAGSPIHSFEPHQVRVPGVCNKPHGSKVTCGQAGDP